MISPKIRQSFPLLVLAWVSLALFSCSSDETPKPRAFFRIDMPKKEYRSFDTAFPYSFEYPVYALVKRKDNQGGYPYWLNIEFPAYKGTLHLSYIPLSGNLNKLLEDSRELVNKHIPKSSGIDEAAFENPGAHVYGSLFEIRGSQTASPYQFFLTDSTHHFLRGALYFNVKPNNDSLSPVIEFLKLDIDRFIESFRWK